MPSTYRRRAPTDAEREQRRAEQRQLVTEAVEQLRSSEGWLSYLRARRHFHDYSLLIWRPNVLVGKGSGGFRRRHVTDGGAPRRWSDPRSAGRRWK